ncbi:MAG TPA: pirin family protein [Polyangia bacterium]|jgi:redox-sensitive bicupin YhaK (pirin superfamily)
MLVNQIQIPRNHARKIVYRTRGNTGGPITRLVSPSDLGQLIKPFVFLDHFHFDGRGPRMPMELGWHPHSGIATVTVVLEGAVRYAETTGKAGLLSTGSVEWMRAGNGVWHTGEAEPDGVRGFQLWVALPPELENAPNASHYVMPEESPIDGPVRVILGSHGTLKSPIDAPPMNYLVVSLKAGERWSYEPPKGHEVAWVAVHEGSLLTPTPIPGGEIAIFEPSGAAIEFLGERDTVFVLGSAPPHRHELALGSYSVHTSARALRRGEEEIRRIGAGLIAQGKKSYALREYGEIRAIR